MLVTLVALSAWLLGSLAGVAPSSESPGGSVASARATTASDTLTAVRQTLDDQTLTATDKVWRIVNQTAPELPTPPSGRPPPIGDRRGWRQVFLDDFRTNVPLGEFPENPATVNRWWAYPPNWHDTSGNGTYDAHRTVSIQGGLLNIYLHTDPTTGTPLVAALVPKPSGASGDSTHPNLLYGRYAIRFRADPLPRYKVASIIWPASGDLLADGEIDFPEGRFDDTIHGYVHHTNGSSGGDQDRFVTRARFPNWHTATIAWTPGKVRYSLDGKLVGTSTKRVPKRPMRWIIQTETGIGTGVPDPRTAGFFQIDWVAIWHPVHVMTADEILTRITAILDKTSLTDATKVRRIHKVSTSLQP